MTAAPSLVVLGYRLPIRFAERWQALVSAPVHPRDRAAGLSTLLEQVPGFAPARVQLARALLMLDRYRDAHAEAMRVAEAEATEPAFALEQVLLLRRFEALEAVERVVDRMDFPRCPPALLVRLAGELGPAGLYAHAARALDAAESKAPLPPQGLVLRGTLRMAAGDEVGAGRCFEAALAKERRSRPHVQWLLSLLPAPDTVREARLDGLYADMDAAPADRADGVYAGYALHNTLHALGRRDEAWNALSRAHVARRRVEPYDRSAQQAIFDALLETSATPGPVAGSEAGDGLVFIVGMHRSGTSLLERMLGAHGEIADGGESYVFPAAMRHAVDHAARNPLDLELVRRARDADLSHAGTLFERHARWRAGGRRWFIEKLPSNFLHVGHILRALPAARVLHMRRDPMDTCFSNLRTLFLGAAPYAADQRDLADYYRCYQALMAHWRSLAPDRILDVDYAALVAEPAQTLRRIAQFCGFQFRDEMLAPRTSGGHVATASLASVRKGLLRDRGGQWKAYARYLGPLLEGLGVDADGG